jgi:two-component system, response regulator
VGGARRRGGAILLVEDNPDDEALTLRAFQKNNLTNEIIVKRDGAEALAWLFDEKRQVDPQVILLDLKLPKVDGLEVLRQIRADPSTSYLPVVILTSSSVESDLVRGYELRANSYIRKPVDFSRFIDAAREIGLYWLVLNEMPPRTPPK